MLIGRAQRVIISGTAGGLWIECSLGVNGESALIQYLHQWPG